MPLTWAVLWYQLPPDKDFPLSLSYGENLSFDRWSGNSASTDLVLNVISSCVVLFYIFFSFQLELMNYLIKQVFYETSSIPDTVKCKLWLPKHILLTFFT